MLLVPTEPQLLAHICKSKKVVAVVGSHGKTTTTGMLTWALDQIGFDFSYMVGGRFRNDVLAAGKASSKSHG